MKKSARFCIFWITLSILGAFILAILLRKPLPSVPLSTQKLHFEGQIAYQKTGQLSENFPFRIQGNKNLDLSADWIESEFKNLGYTPQAQTFQERLYDVTYSDLRNIWVEKKGTTHPEEIVIVCAHYDISEKTQYGAMDDASGIGIIFELAKIFKEENTARTLIFLAVNAEELGAHWGARSFIQDFDRIHQVKAVVTFDFVAPNKQVGIIQLQDGEKRGFTPLWLRQLSLQSISSIPTLIPDDLQNIMEYIQKATVHPASDHGVFLRAGIPALNWVGKSSEFPLELNEVHHTLKDRVDVMRTESFHDYGQAAERLLRSIDELKEIPDEPTDSNHFKLSDHSYLPGTFVTGLQFLLFLPFFVFCLSQILKHRVGGPWKRNSEFLYELKCISQWVGALTLGYLVLRSFPTLNLLPYFEMQPGAAKSDLSHSISILVVSTIFFFIVFFYYLFKALSSPPKPQPNRFQSRLLAQITLFSVLCLLGLFLNPFTATLFLLVPAYAWIAIYQWNSSIKKRALFSLCLAGAFPFALIFSVIGFMYQNYYIFYYLILCAIYGLFEVSTTVVALSSFVIFFRMAYCLYSFFRPIPIASNYE